METRTCRNMHESVTQSPAICKVGCVCKDGYVKDSPSGSCVKERECPCYHGGKSYKETSVVQDDCNTCKCESGKWNCTDRPCAGLINIHNSTRIFYFSNLYITMKVDFEFFFQEFVPPGVIHITKLSTDVCTSSKAFAITSWQKPISVTTKYSKFRLKMFRAVAQASLAPKLLHSKLGMARQRRA